MLIISSIDITDLGIIIIIIIIITIITTIVIIKPPPLGQLARYMTVYYIVLYQIISYNRLLDYNIL